MHGSKTFSVGIHTLRILRWFQCKIRFFKIFHFQVLNFEFNIAIFQKLRGQKISQFYFLGHFLTLKNMVLKNSDMVFKNSDFLGIKSKINQCGVQRFRTWINMIWWESVNSEFPKDINRRWLKSFFPFFLNED